MRRYKKYCVTLLSIWNQPYQNEKVYIKYQIPTISVLCLLSDIYVDIWYFGTSFANSDISITKSYMDFKQYQVSATMEKEINHRFITHLIGLLLAFESILLLLCYFVSIMFGESDLKPFILLKASPRPIAFGEVPYAQ